MDNDELIHTLNKELSVELPEKITYSDIHAKLAIHFNHLIKNDFDNLIAYLYRIDVSEQKLKILLQQFPEEDTGNIIAALVMERQQQKIKTREQFSQRDNNITEEEKW